MDEALQPGREHEGAGNFPFPIQALGAEGADRWVTKGVNRPEKAGQGGVGEGHLGLLELGWGEDKFKSGGQPSQLENQSRFQAISICETWVETKPPQNPPAPSPQYT